MTVDITPTPKRGRPRLRPVDQPRDYAVEYSRRKAGAQKRGEVATVTNPVRPDDRMQAPCWRHVYASARWLAWMSDRPQAIVVYYHMGLLRYAVRCAAGSLPLCCDAELVWVEVPRRMPRIPLDV